MRAEVEHHLLLAPSENPRIGKCGQTRADFDRTSTSIVQTSPLEEPSVDVPCPAGERAVYNGSPAPDEDHHGDEATTLSDTTDDDSSGDGTELHLQR